MPRALSCCDDAGCCGDDCCWAGSPAADCSGRRP